MLLDKNRHNDYVALIDKIAKIEHPNATACNGLIYAIDHMEEEELLRMASNNWEHVLPLLNNNERFLKQVYGCDCQQNNSMIYSCCIIVTVLNFSNIGTNY